MLLRLLLILGISGAVSPLLAQSRPTSVPAAAEDDSQEESWAEGEQADTLDFTQREQQARLESGIGLNLGPVMPWAELGLTSIWRQKPGMASLSVGLGEFEFSDNYKERNFVVKTKSQSVYFAFRYFILPFGPLYVEPMLGLVNWTGSVEPRGADELTDEIATSLTSKFSASGLSTGGNLGLMWIFSNRIFLDYNLLSVSWSALFNEQYSTGTSITRSNVRKQIQGPLSLGNAHLRIGWSWLI